MLVLHLVRYLGKLRRGYVSTIREGILDVFVSMTRDR